ncbi:PKD domain-containing protein, partial [Candidatus Uhrbacteria bacterium]|nr:PKD domain-containing protein [Candidatus Uhrbacteria bacterium]
MVLMTHLRPFGDHNHTANLIRRANSSNGDQTTGSGATPSHTYTGAGTYTAVVTASNSANALTATTSVTVTDVPVAGVSATNDSPTTLGQATNLTATVTAGTNVTYTWDFGDDTTGSGATPAHTYSGVGSYT